MTVQSFVWFVKVFLLSALTFLRVSGEELDDAEYQVVEKVIKSCSTNKDRYSCLANKAADALERTIDWDVPLFDGFTLTKNEEFQKANHSSEAKFLGNGIDRLSSAVSNFLNSHTLTLDLTSKDSVTARRKGGGGYGGFGGGGKIGKKEKKYFQYALMVLLGVFGISGPLILKGLSLLAGKALVASKIALIIVGSVALKKIFEKDGDHSTVKVHTHTVQDHHEDNYDRRIDPSANKFWQNLI